MSAGLGFQFNATTTFNLPIPSNLLFLTFTNVSGPTMSGSIDIVTSPSQPSNAATVQVITFYNQENIYKGSNVSLVQRGPGENGVAVSVLEWVYQQSNAKLAFEMTATLPEPSNPPLVLQGFETDAQNAVQTVGDLKDKVLFQNLNLTGTDGAINVQSLTANQGRIATTDGAINGNFYTSGELTISSGDGQIQADVDLTSTGGSTPKVSLSSTNGPNKSNITLATSSGSGGSFQVSTSSTDGDQTINFPSAPVNSNLTYVGTSTDGNVNISLNPAYEGAVSLSSHESTPTVNQQQQVDPSGQQRKQVVSLNPSSKHAVTGQISWGESSTPGGTVNVQTGDGTLVLTLVEATDAVGNVTVSAGNATTSGGNTTNTPQNNGQLPARGLPCQQRWQYLAIMAIVAIVAISN